MMALEKNEKIKCLGDLLEGIRSLDPVLAGVPILGLQLDSRAVKSDQLFIACKGTVSDGRQFIREAVATGAAAVLAEYGEEWVEDTDCDGVPVLVVEGLAKKVSEIAGQFYDHPSRELPVIGVTGTNGKTTCTQLIAQFLAALNKRCGVIGTLGVGVNSQMAPGINTTPDAISIQQQLAQWNEEVDTVAMEVSSHGLEQGRVAAIHFQIALFTNLSRDHLDYHGSMEAYGQAKLQLFLQPGLHAALVNLDDPFSRKILEAVPQDVSVLTFSLTDQSADVYLKDTQFLAAGVEACLVSPWGEISFQSPLLGAFNLSNVLGAVTALVVMGYDLSQLVPAFAQLKAVDGRMEQVVNDADLVAVVDYAHTPDGLTKALQAMRQHGAGRLWCVFGCGGDRDKGKRPEMGAVVERWADCAVVTSDNPRSENPQQILEQIVSGMKNSPECVEPDREKAIAYAVANAAKGDAVLVAGKGHESYQQVGQQRLPFSDLQQLRLALGKRAQGERRL